MSRKKHAENKKKNNQARRVANEFLKQCYGKGWTLRMFGKSCASNAELIQQLRFSNPQQTFSNLIDWYDKYGRSFIPSEQASKCKKNWEKHADIDPRSDEFLLSWEWRTLRYRVLQKHDRRCMCCGATPDDGVTVLHVDHIKPRSKYPAQALNPENLQVLCHICNQGKGAWDETDFRSNRDEYEFQCALAEQAKRLQ